MAAPMSLHASLVNGVAYKRSHVLYPTAPVQAARREARRTPCCVCAALGDVDPGKEESEAEEKVKIDSFSSVVC